MQKYASIHRMGNFCAIIPLKEGGPIKNKKQKQIFTILSLRFIKQSLRIRPLLN